MQTKYYQTFDCKIPNILQSNQKYLLQSTFCIRVYVQPGTLKFTLWMFSKTVVRGDGCNT